ncbi:MAG: glycosyltransferase family 39 protein, partial [Tepidisphaeraceae bacterium]
MSESGRSFGVPQDDRHLGTRYLLALIAILLLAAALRVYHIGEKSLWWDEFQSLAMACGRGFTHLQLPTGVVIAHPPKVIDLATALPIRVLWTEPQGHMPPLYPLVLRFWLTVFGTGPESVRAFSAVMSVAAVALVFLVVRETLGTTTGLWAALLMAVASPQVQLGQEGRLYTLLLVEALGAALALLRIERHGPTLARAAALTLCVLAMALTHYFTAGALLALALYAGLRLRGPRLKAALACFLVAGIAWL